MISVTFFNIALSGKLLHDVGGRALHGQLVGHEVHVGCDMVVELPVAFAEIVEAGVAVAVVDDSVLGAFAVASELDIALATLAG